MLGMLGMLVPISVLLALFVFCHTVLSGGDASSRVCYLCRTAIRRKLTAVGQMANRTRVVATGSACSEARRDAGVATELAQLVVGGVADRPCRRVVVLVAGDDAVGDVVDHRDLDVGRNLAAELLPALTGLRPAFEHAESISRRSAERRLPESDLLGGQRCQIALAAAVRVGARDRASPEFAGGDEPSAMPGATNRVRWHPPGLQLAGKCRRVDLKQPAAAPVVDSVVMAEDAAAVAPAPAGGNEPLQRRRTGRRLIGRVKPNARAPELARKGGTDFVLAEVKIGQRAERREGAAVRVV